MFPAGLHVGRCRVENMLFWKQINRSTEKGCHVTSVYNGVWRILQPTSWALIWWQNALKRVRVTQMMPKTEYGESWRVFLFFFPLTGLWCSAVFVFSQGLGAESKNLYPFLLPVIQLSTDVSQPPHVYLLEDGLELWYESVHLPHIHTEPEILGDLISALTLRITLTYTYTS